MALPFGFAASPVLSPDSYNGQWKVENGTSFAKFVYHPPLELCWSAIQQSSAGGLTSQRTRTSQRVKNDELPSFTGKKSIRR